MSESRDTLFDRVEIRSWTLKNRIVMPPMVSVREITGEDGIEWYRRHAKGGPGLVIVEATSIWRFGADLTVESLKPLVDAIHDGGAVAAIQLFPVKIGTRPEVSSLSVAEIRRTCAQFGEAAQICREAGMDGVEPHGAHGYLLNRFFSPSDNDRTDEYGVSLANRMRFGLQVVRAIRDAVGDDLLLLYRHTPAKENSYGMEDSLAFARRLAAAGVDVLDISPSSIDAAGDRAEPFRALGVPVIAVGTMDERGRARETLEQGRADLIAVGRGLIADPDWPEKVHQGRWEAITACTKCNKLCFGNLRKGEPIACIQWTSW